MVGIYDCPASFLTFQPFPAAIGSIDFLPELERRVGALRVLECSRREAGEFGRHGMGLDTVVTGLDVSIVYLENGLVSYRIVIIHTPAVAV